MSLHKDGIHQILFWQPEIEHNYQTWLAYRRHVCINEYIKKAEFLCSVVYVSLGLYLCALMGCATMAKWRQHCIPGICDMVNQKACFETENTEDTTVV